MERRMLLARDVSSILRPRVHPRPSRGFTLVELAVVVVIVGVLSMIAVVGYRRYMLHAKITEAKGMVSAIRVAQEDFRAETGRYANIGGTYCPTATPSAAKKWAWDPTCSGGASTWETLPVHSDGPVMFSYATVASTPASPAWSEPANTDWVTWNNPTQTPWFVVMAWSDLDQDGNNTPKSNTMVVGMSFQNTIFAHNEGL